MNFSKAISEKGFGFSYAMTLSRSLNVQINRSNSHVALWSPIGLNITLIFCSSKILAKISDFFRNKFRPLVHSNFSSYSVQSDVVSKKVYDGFRRCARYCLRRGEF